MAKDDAAPQPPEKTLSRAAFLGGLLGFLSAVALSVVGVGHSRSLQGAANPQYWIVVAIVSASLAAVTLGLARATARTKSGEAARKIAVAAAALWLFVFLWETIATGSGAATGPFELAWGAWKG
jgi:hypothetical protein